nr:transposase [Corynebacterium sp. c6VSa_13]
MDELLQLARTHHRWREDLLALFAIAAPNGPVEKLNGKGKIVSGVALGFQHLSHYIERSFLHNGRLQSGIFAL